MQTTKIGSDSLIRQLLSTTQSVKPRPVNPTSIVEVKPAAPAPADAIAFNAKAAPIELATSLSSAAPCGPATCGTPDAETPALPPVDSAPENIAPGEPDATDSASEPLTIDGFHAAWGQSNSAYDLNSDGTVNMDDLLQFIASQPATGSPTNSEVSDPADVAPTNEGAAKPEVIPPADVMPELIDPVPADPLPPSDVAPEARPEPDAPQLTIDGLLAAWSNGPATGADISMYDLNADGTVNMDDLLQLLGQLSPGNSGNARLANGPSTSDPNDAAGAPTNGTRHAHGHDRKLTTLVDSLIDRLNQAGFENQPPTNIRELVASLDLSPSQTNSAIKQLHQRYPHGLGVNVTA